MVSRRELPKLYSANERKVFHLRQFIKNDVDHTQVDRNKPICFKKYHKYSVTLPPYQLYPPELQDIYTRSLLDLDMKDDLERGKVINWCKTTKPLVPLKTTGDGNCLLHAVSLGMWGLEDDDQFLRRLLYITLVNDETQHFKRRWLIRQHNVDPTQSSGANFQLNTVESEREWETIKNAASDLRPASQIGYLQFPTLEAIHLFALANILKRTLVVLANKSAQTVFGGSIQENNISGIYLPLEWRAEECCKSPLLLGYSLNHFAPLVMREDEPVGHRRTADGVVMLVHEDLSPFVVQFLLPDEETEISNILKAYLNIGDVEVSQSGRSSFLLGAQIDPKPLPEDLDLVKDHRDKCESLFRNQIGERENNSFPPMNVPTSLPNRENGQYDDRFIHITSQGADITIENSKNINIGIGLFEEVPGEMYHNNLSPQSSNKPAKCITVGCDMFGSPSTANLCSKCFKLFTVHYQREEAYRQRNPPTPPTPLPTAPPLSHPVQESLIDMSLMGEQCRNKCGFHCSTETFPYCHECHNRMQKQNAQVHPAPEVIASASSNSEVFESENAEVREMELSRSDEQNMFGSGTPSEGNAMETESNLLINLEPEHSLVCSTPNCKKKAKREQNNRCSHCFLNIPVISPSGPSLGGLAVWKHDKKPEDLLGPALGESIYSEPSMSSPSLKHLCATPGCKGIRMENRTNSCWECWKKNKVNKARAEQRPVCGPPTGNNRLESSVIESCNLLEIEENEVNPLITTSRDKVRCASATCNNMIYPPKKLCDECQMMLSTSMAAKMKKEGRSRQGAHTGLSGHCKTHGCEFFVQTGKKYCSSCSKARDSRRMVTSPMTAPVRTNIGIVDRRRTAPIIRQGARCLEPGCDKYGDPANNNCCSYHFNRQKGAMDYTPQTQHIIQRPLNFIPYTQAPFPRQISNSNFNELHRNWHSGMQEYSENVNYEVPEPNQMGGAGLSDFSLALKKVENERKSKMKCLSRGCSNFGNTAKKGYCNSCYVEFCQTMN
ncbi:hypothetical protein ScPMuIL_012607 [Solemya velum]